MGEGRVHSATSITPPSGLRCDRRSSVVRRCPPMTRERIRRAFPVGKTRVVPRLLPHTHSPLPHLKKDITRHGAVEHECPIQTPPLTFRRLVRFLVCFFLQSRVWRSIVLVVTIFCRLFFSAFMGVSARYEEAGRITDPLVERSFTAEEEEELIGGELCEVIEQQFST